MSEDLSMSDVVRMVLVAETESKRIQQEAQETAEHLLTEARRKAQDIVQTKRRETMEQVDALIAAAEREALQQKQQRLAEAAEEIESLVQLDEPAVRSAIARVVRCVCGGWRNRAG